MDDFDPDAFLANTKDAETPAAASSDTASFDPDAFLSGTASSGGGIPAPEPATPDGVAPMGIPGVSTGPALYEPLNIGKNVVAPIAKAIPNTLAGYWRNPMTAAADAVAASMTGGTVLPYAAKTGLEGIKGAYEGAKSIINDPLVMAADHPKAQALAAAEQQVLKHTPSGIDAKQLESIIKSGKVPVEAASKVTPEFESALNNYKLALGAVGKGSEASLASKLLATKTAQAILPALSAANKFLGPAGMAYNLYEAGKTARDTGLGQRIAEGQAHTAQRAFRQMNPQYGQSLTPDQAQAMSQSGSPRDIAAFGGQDKLDMAMRYTAAKRVLGQ